MKKTIITFLQSSNENLSHIYNTSFRKKSKKYRTSYIKLLSKGKFRYPSNFIGLVILHTLYFLVLISVCLSPQVIKSGSYAKDTALAKKILTVFQYIWLPYMDEIRQSTAYSSFLVIETIIKIAIFLFLVIEIIVDKEYWFRNLVTKGFMHKIFLWAIYTWSFVNAYTYATTLKCTFGLEELFKEFHQSCPEGRNKVINLVISLIQMTSLTFGFYILLGN